MRRPAGRNLDEGVILELQQLGGYVKATAVDPVTGVEVSIVGSAHSNGRHPTYSLPPGE